jgi:hypothetical protein
MFMTQRSVDRLAAQESNLRPEHYLFQRDMNLMTFGQIVSMPSIAMPFTEDEGWIKRWQFRLRGAVLRAGALAYEFLRHPTESWQDTACDREAFTREAEWPADFAFSYGDFVAKAPPGETIAALEAVVATMAPDKRLKPWQVGVPRGQRYPYDFDAPYRAGEMALLRSMLEMAARRDVSVVLLPLPLYGYTAAPDDIEQLTDAVPRGAEIFDLYGHIGADLSKFWYDDGHVETYPAGALATAVLAQHLLAGGLLPDRQN